MTDSLTGRELDRAVAEAMGWTAVHEFGPISLLGTRPDGAGLHFVPRLSFPDCSGLAPVLAWLTENVPDSDCEVVFEWHQGDWAAIIRRRGEYDTNTIEECYGSTLPLAACRLLVSWSERKGTK